MTNTIRREISFPLPREQVWRALSDSATLAQWMFPNDFEPRVGHHFTFRVPGNPQVNFDGLTVHCEVLECEPPRENAGGRLEFSWTAGGLVDTRVSFRLESDGAGTRVLFEHSGFELTQQFGEQAFAGAEYGWAKMFKQLAAVVENLEAALETTGVAMIGGLKVLRVKEGRQPELEALFAELREVMRAAEPGCLLYSLLRSRVDDRSYIVHEQYRNAQALALHESSPHGKLYFPKIRELLESIQVEYFDGVVS